MDDATSSAADRLAREQSFHDNRFADDSARAPTAKYYSAAQSATARYRRQVADVGYGKRVLEYGCGIGSASWDAATNGASVTGIDISPVAIDQSRAEADRRGLAADFIEMNAEKLDFDAHTFDLVCGSGILHHLDLGAAYAEVSRVLRPSGSAWFYEPLGHNPLINLYRRLTPEMRTDDEHPLKMTDLEAARRWFGRVDVEFYGLTSLLASPLTRFTIGRKLATGLSWLDRWIFRLLPPTRRWAWICLLRLGEPRSGL